MTDYRSIVAALSVLDDHVVEIPSTQSRIDSIVSALAPIGAAHHAAPVVISATLPVLPARHFAQDDPPAGTPLQITDDGRVWGLVAPSGVCHRGLPGCVTVESLEAGGAINWQGGHTSSPLRLDDGTEIRTLPITMRGGHPDTDRPMSAAEARAHHDDTATVVADVVAWRSPAGVAVSGTVRRNLDEDDLREMMGSSPSIEIWPTEAGRVLLGIQLVPTPAWPVAAAFTDDGVAILESGRVEQQPCDCHDEPTVEQRLELLERVAVASLSRIDPS